MPKKTKSKPKKVKDGEMNILEEMNKLPTLDLLRICLTGVAVLHERAVISVGETNEEPDNSNDDVAPEPPTLVMP